MTQHAITQPLTQTETGMIWQTACGRRVTMPPRAFKVGTVVDVADGKSVRCPACFEEEETRSPELIEAQQRVAEDRPQLTFDDTLGEIEADDTLGEVEAETDDVLSEEKDEYSG